VFDFRPDVINGTRLKAGERMARIDALLQKLLADTAIGWIKPGQVLALMEISNAAHRFIWRPRRIRCLVKKQEKYNLNDGR